MYRQSEKMLSSNISSTRPHNMVNFGPLAAEIGSVVWGTPANFKRFGVLAALLHGTLVVGVKLCGVEQRAPPMFGRATITLGIGPHSSISVLFTCRRRQVDYLFQRRHRRLSSSLDNDVIAGCHNIGRHGNNAGSAAEAGALQDRVLGSVERFVR